MMISEKMNANLNEQISAELFAAYKYLAMACAFERMGLKVLAERFLDQCEEERGHAMRIVRYVQEVGAKVELEAIRKPPKDYKDAEAIVKAALEGELAITKLLNDLMALAEKENDYATRSFLHWFVDEQVEEVASMTDLLTLVKLSRGNMLQVEARVRHEMGKKT